MPCMNLVEPLENYMSPSQIGEGYDATSGLSHWSQSRGNHSHCGDQSLIGLPLITPSFPPGTHDYDPNRHNLIEGIVSKSMITRQEAQAKFNEYHETEGSHDEVYTDGSKMNERVGAAAVINRHFLNGETTCRHLSKILPDNNTIFAAEATAIALALNYYQYVGLVHHDVVVYSDSMFCLQAIEDKSTNWEHFYLPYHEPPLAFEWQRHICSLLLDTEPLWNRRKWKSRLAGKRDPWPWHRPTSKCPPCGFQAIGPISSSCFKSSGVWPCIISPNQH